MISLIIPQFDMIIIGSNKSEVNEISKSTLFPLEKGSDPLFVFILHCILVDTLTSIQ